MPIREPAQHRPHPLHSYHALTNPPIPSHPFPSHRIKDSSVAPAHLDGTLPGDFGFDPLGLGADPQRLKYYQEAELMNARWAMMAVAGIVAQEVVTGQELLGSA